jgi:NAD(P)H-hydrate epimerase
MYARLTPRRVDSHKGDFGHALLIGGSRSMPGAIALAASGALRGGAGLVTVATAESCHAVVAGLNPCAMTIALPEDKEGRIARRGDNKLVAIAQKASCLAIGPGLGRSAELAQWIQELFLTFPLPMVLDADAINALAGRQMDFVHAPNARVFTPHAGEFQRLTGSTESKRSGQEEDARSFAALTGAVVLLKGHRSFVTDGQHIYRNETGNSGMATGGCGDVLTGLIAAFICQGLPPFDATCYATHVHGLAGDMASAEIGPIGMLATDLADRIPAALRRSMESNRAQ